MNDPAPAIEFLFSEDDLVPWPDDAELPFREEGELRWGTRFDVPMRLVVARVDLFRRNDEPGLEPGYRSVHLLDLVLQFARELDPDRRSYEYLDPWEDSWNLGIVVGDDQITFTADDETTVVRVPRDTAIRDIQAFCDRVRRLIVAVSADFLTHPQLGPWLRGERAMPTLDDHYCYRRAPHTIVFPCHDYDAVRELARTAEVGVERADTLEIRFTVDAAVVADAHSVDLTKETNTALFHSFFQMPLSIRAGDRHLLQTVLREKDGSVSTLDYRVCPLLRAVFDLDDLRSHMAIGGHPVRLWAGIEDVDGQRDLLLGHDAEGVWLEPRISVNDHTKQNGVSVVVPDSVFIAEVTRFNREVAKFFDTHFPGIFDRAFADERERLTVSPE